MWQRAGAHDSFRQIWEFLSKNIPIGDMETLTIVSPNGYVLYSMAAGTRPVLTPTEAHIASTGIIWQLQSYATSMIECGPVPPVTEGTIAHALHRLYESGCSPQPQLQLSPNVPSSTLKKARNLSNLPSKPAVMDAEDTPSRRKVRVQFLSTLADSDPDSISSDLDETVDMPTANPATNTPTFLSSNSKSDATPMSSSAGTVCNFDDNLITDMRQPPLYSIEEGPLSASHPLFSTSTSSVNNTLPHALTGPIPSNYPFGSAYIGQSTGFNPHTTLPSVDPVPLDDSSEPDPEWEDPPTDGYRTASYQGPVDDSIHACCVVISGFMKSIGSNGNIAKATHAMMNAAQIKHRLTPDTNHLIRPEFNVSPNICGFFPLETDSYDFRRYPLTSEEKPIFQQFKANPTDGSNYYHHFMSFALPVTPEAFRSARTIGAFRGAIPNANFIPLQIRELHRIVFHSDPKILLFPNSVRTNIAATHNAKLLHETVIMVKSLHAINTADIIAKYKLNKRLNLSPAPLTFFSNLAALTSQLKACPDFSLQSSVIIRSSEAEHTFHLPTVYNQLLADPSLPWDDIYAILPMDLTSKSAKAIELAYLTWHPTDHIVIIRKDGSDQRALQKSINEHLTQHGHSDLIAKCERHIPGVLDRVFRKYAGIDASQPTSNSSTPSFQPSSVTWPTPANSIPRNISRPTGASYASVTKTTEAPPNAMHTTSTFPPPSISVTSGVSGAASNPSPSRSSHANDKDISTLLTSLQHIIEQQNNIISRLDQQQTLFDHRLAALEVQPTHNHSDMAATIATAIATAMENSLAQQLQLFTSFIATLHERLPSPPQPPPRTGGSIYTPNNNIQHSTFLPSLPLLPPSDLTGPARSATLPAPTPSTPHYWMSEHDLLAVLQSQSAAPIIPVPLDVPDSTLTKPSHAALQAMLLSPATTSSLVLGVVFAGNQHWQPLVLQPTKKVAIIWDIAGPLCQNSSIAISSALPDWSLTIHHIPTYPDGACGPVALNILMAVASGRPENEIKSPVLTFPIAITHGTPPLIPTQYGHQRYGGSTYINHSHVNLPTTSPSTSHPEFSPTFEYPSSPASPSHTAIPSPTSTNISPDISPMPTTDTTSSPPNPWDDSVAMQDQLLQSQSCIGSLQHSDIRMASININSLTDDKLPFLAWMFIKFNLDILAIQDTRILHDNWRFTREAASPIFPPNTLFLHSPPLPHGNSNAPIGGVAIIISQRCCAQPNFHPDPLRCGAICGYSFATLLGRMLIISAYFPNKSPDLQGSLWSKIQSSLPTPTPPDNPPTPLQHLMATADAWSSLPEAAAGTFLLGDLNASIGTRTIGGCHNIQS